jgi:hypothetical protein
MMDEPLISANEFSTLIRIFTTGTYLMKFYNFFTSIVLVFVVCVTQAKAQHSDIEFGYNNLSTPTAFVLEGSAFTVDGLPFWASDFFEIDPFNPGDYGSDEPGFTTNAGEGLLINTNDRIFLRVLNAAGNSAFGVGWVNYFNPNTGLLEASASNRMAGEHNSGAFNTLFFNGLGIESGDNPLFLGAGSASGNLHDHILFDLLDDATAPFGAYGVLFRMEADFASNGFGQTDLTSDAFWIIWNHGMSESDFLNAALPAFGAIPEPSSLFLLSMAGLGMMLRRRR